MHRSLSEQIDDRIDDWHEGRRTETTLREALGYDRWLGNPHLFPDRPLPP